MDLFVTMFFFGKSCIDGIKLSGKLANQHIKSVEEDGDEEEGWLCHGQRSPH